MITTPLAERLKIVVLGVVNAGKSSLMNTLLDKKTSIVSEIPGTTTDPVTRSYELGELGPVAFTDTAGFDDSGALGRVRMQRSREAIATCDIALLASPLDKPPCLEEKKILEEAEKRGKTTLVALTFADRPPDSEKAKWGMERNAVRVDNISGQGARLLRKRIEALHDKALPEGTPVEGIVREGDLVILVVPIDLATPKGRLILPQVETLRDLLDHDCHTLVVKERELRDAYDRLREAPSLVITDSQVFHKVAADIPPTQKLTSFSLLFARKKGDLREFVKGIQKLSSIPKESHILVMESCSHHRQADDIGTVKIPRLYRQMVSAKARFSFSRTLPDPEEIRTYDMIIHCAGCMQTRSTMLDTIDRARSCGVLITNYGLFLGWANGLLPRALEPFPDMYALWEC